MIYVKYTSFLNVQMAYLSRIQDRHNRPKMIYHMAIVFVHRRYAYRTASSRLLGSATSMSAMINDTIAIAAAPRPISFGSNLSGVSATE